MTAFSEKDVISSVTETVEQTLKMPSGKLELDADFDSFGLDSIIAMELMKNLSQRFGLSITPAQFTDVNTLHDLAMLIAEQLKLKESENNSNDDAIDNSNDNSKNKSVVDAVAERNVDTRMQVKETHRYGQSTYVAKNSTTESIEIGQKVLSQRLNAQHNGATKQPSFLKLLSYVNSKFNIDLGYQQYQSLDHVVHTLVSNHYEELIQHYRLGNDSASQYDSKESIVSDTNNKSLFQARNDIAIVGMSCRFPDADNPSDFWKNLIQEHKSIQEIPTHRWDWKEYYSETAASGKTVSRWGALLEDVDCFDASFFGISIEEAKMMDPQERLLLEQVYKAFEDANMAIDRYAGSNTGLFMAYEFAEYEQRLRKNSQSNIHFSSSSPTYYLANRVSFALDFCGPSESININCASSAIAINRAFYALLNQETDVAVAGGVSLNLFVDDYIAESQYGMLSPTGTCGVFDNDANGFTRGEGVGVIVLKRLADAEKDNDRIYGVIKGCHQNNRGKASFMSEIKHESISKVVEDCYRKFNIEKESVNYIEVDGYSTKWGDSFEFEGLKNAFKGNSGAKHCALGSAKGNIGHLEPASGIASVIKVAMSLYNKSFPPTVSSKSANEFIDFNNKSHPFYLGQSEIDFESIRVANNPIRAGINSFADSGANVHLLLEEYLPKVHLGNDDQTDDSDSPHLILLSAKNNQSLNAIVDSYLSFLSNMDDDQSLRDIAYSTQVGRESMTERLAIVAQSKSELIKKLTLVKHAKTEALHKLQKELVFRGRLETMDQSALLKFITKGTTESKLIESFNAQQWDELAMLWVSGVEVPWFKAWKNARSLKNIKSVTLPSYPLNRERFWFNTVDSKVNASSSNSGFESSTIETILQTEIPLNLKRAEEVVPPTNNVEKKLLELWANILKIDHSQIGIYDEFIDSGADSLAVMKLASDIKKEFGQIVPLDSFFTTSTIAALALLIEEDVEYTFERLVCLQKDGVKLPIFAVPGAAGNVTSFIDLSRALGSEQPFYGFQPDGLDGVTTPLTSVKAIAQANIVSMKKAQPKGPYKLLGHSFGGLVAFEMARLLVENKEKVESLIFLDAVHPSVGSDDSIETEIIRVCNEIMVQRGVVFNLTEDDIAALSESERLDFLYNRMSKDGFDIPKEQFETGLQLAISNEKSSRLYEPVSITKKLPVYLFKAMKSNDELPGDYGWNAHLKQPVDAIDVDTTHVAIVDELSSKTIGHYLKKTESKSKKTTKATRKKAVS